MVKKKRVIRRTRRVVRHTAAARTAAVKIVKPPPEKTGPPRQGMNEAARRAMAGPDVDMPDEKRRLQEKKVIDDQGWRNT